MTYFNPADTAFPIGYNVLGGWKKEERDRAASSVVSVFNAIWNLSLQNPIIHSILGNSIAALMEFKNATLLWLPRFLTDDDWRKEHTKRLPTRPCAPSGRMISISDLSVTAEARASRC